ncbi:AcrR family transcriptional regulator [Kineosphaera limosa]|uniref:Putative TetR family transcriptional regulator n=1 Tax=Kineosphaera limosa NBRC 100340 TaxID=1184609 RepID=K6WSL5_9MICO|nr:TetR family transcriptional regulator [Kineosphaera limosa]NYE03005.1 AcrR family transcriptional regulator [Kineosphaera limosa]GAB95102.1 putative TetR family transcriptional regulator [Kineosphaera limosa NBRC 100340]
MAQQLSARRRATRERLLTAATIVFVERGVVAATVEEICEAAGFTRGAFYSNFADKDELIEELLAREHADVLTSLAALTESELPHLSPDGSGQVDLTHLVHRFLTARLIGRSHYLLHTELTLAAARDPEGQQPFRQASARATEKTTEAITESLRRAGLEPILNPADLIEVLYGLFERSNARALIDGDPDADALARRALPVVLGALTRPLSSGSLTPGLDPPPEPAHEPTSKPTNKPTNEPTAAR